MTARIATTAGFVTILMLGTLVAPASADGRRDHHRGGERQGYHRRWDRGGYYPAPPIVYGYPEYYPPPVVYGPGIRIIIR